MAQGAVGASGVVGAGDGRGDAVVMGAWMNATTPGDFPNPLILIAFLLAALLGCFTLLFLGIYIFGSLVFRSRRAYADEEL